MDVTPFINTHPLILTDAGLETDMIFNRGFELPAFAAHTLLDSPAGRTALTDYYLGFIELAEKQGAALLLDAPTWRAQSFFANELGVQASTLKETNEQAITFLREMIAARSSHATVLVNAPIGPRGDAYAPEEWLSVEGYEAYHSEQLGWLAGQSADLVTALTFTNSAEALGITRAARKLALPIAISFTVETDGRLPSGECVNEAIEKVDQSTLGEPLYYLINCAHPDHMSSIFVGDQASRRIKGMRCNASRMSHSELDAAPELDRGDCCDLASLCRAMKFVAPWLTIWGGCCGTDVSHVAAIAKAVCDQT